MSQTAQEAIIYTSPKHSVYVGRLERVFRRANVASTLLVSIDGEMDYLDVAGREIARSSSFLIPAGVDVAINTHDKTVLQCFLDDMGTGFAKLAPQMLTDLRVQDSGHLFSGLKHEKDIIRQATELLYRRPDTKDAMGLLEDWIDHWVPDHRTTYDERVATAASLIKTNYAENIPVSYIAEQVNLSVPRLVQLFKKTTGVPIRRFRLWHRVFVTANIVAQGYSMTEAAVAAGFADYSHFSRVYRELSGGCPSEARQHTEIRGCVYEPRRSPGLAPDSAGYSGGVEGL